MLKYSKITVWTAKYLPDEWWFLKFDNQMFPSQKTNANGCGRDSAMLAIMVNASQTSE